MHSATSDIPHVSQRSLLNLTILRRGGQPQSRTVAAKTWSCCTCNILHTIAPTPISVNTRSCLVNTSFMLFMYFSCSVILGSTIRLKARSCRSSSYTAAPMPAAWSCAFAPQLARSPQDPLICACTALLCRQVFVPFTRPSSTSKSSIKMF